MKILITDDDLDMARYVAAVFEAEGASCDIAASAETARNLFIRDDFDALVIDAVLPGESGVSLAKGLREFSPGIPILFCTGATDEFNRKLMGKLGTVCHKPLGAEFHESVRQFLSTVKKPQ